MIKINYKSEENIQKLKTLYIQAFIGNRKDKGISSKKQFDNISKSLFNNYTITFEILLSANFEELLIIQKEIGQVVNDPNALIELKKIFDYDGTFQKDYIAPFYEEHIKPTTCYYCNIDFINAYETRGAKRGLEFKNGFTLDHVLDKGKYPYFALSLFNLVPSCYICNSKLKGFQSIGEDVSPTSENFDFHEKVKFKTYFSSNNHNLQIEKQDDIEVFLREFASTPIYNTYINVLKLNDRYAFHRYHVIEMIDKRKRYPDSRIQELAQLTEQTTMQVKKDLFGEYLHDDDLSKRPLAKLTRDIAEELGLV
jgi:hypothetical protein